MMAAAPTAAMRRTTAAMGSATAHMGGAETGMRHRMTATTAEARAAAEMRGPAHSPRGKTGMTEMRRSTAAARREACPCREMTCRRHMTCRAKMLGSRMTGKSMRGRHLADMRG